MEYDYTDHQTTPEAGDNLVKALTTLANDLEAAESLIVSLEQQLSEAKANKKELSEKTIPAMMEGMNAAITLEDGRVLKIAEKVRGSVSAANKAQAYGYLAANGHDGIIKRQFVIQFGKDQSEWAKEFAATLRDQERALNVKQTESVHHQTLTAWVKEQLAEGTDFPQDLFGVYRQQVATVK